VSRSFVAAGRSVYNPGMGTQSDRTYTTALVGALALLCVLFWADCLFGPNAPLAAGFQAQMEPWASEADLPGTDRQWSPLLWDGVAQFYPWRLFAARTMRSGELALWNPHQMCGYPFVGNGQSALFYPPNWLLALVDVKWGLGLLAALHYALAAVLIVLFCRRLGLSHLSCAFAAIAFTFGGFMVTWTELPTLINCLAWLPGALLGVALIFAGDRRGAIVLAVALAMTMLAGHLQIAAYVWAVAGGYALVRLAWAAYRRRALHLKALGGSVAIALLLSAVQLLPSLELAANSPRGHGGPSQAGWEFHQRVALQPAEWIAFLDPDAFGSPVTGDHQLTRFGITYPEHCGFVGIITLLLAVIGVLVCRTRHSIFFLILAALCIHLAMAGTVARLIYFHVPGIGQAGSFARLLSVFTFAVAMAGAFGLDGILRGLPKPAEGRHFLARTAVGAAALLILGLELLPWAHEFLPKTRREHVYPLTPAIEQLMAEEGRVLEVTPRAEWGMAEAPYAVLPPNAATAYGYDSVSGYDSLMLIGYRAWMLRAEGEEVAPAVNGNMMLPERAVGERQALAGLGAVLARTRPRGEGPQEVVLESSHGGTALYRIAPVLPRAFMYDGADEVPDASAVTPAQWRRSGASSMEITLPQARTAQRLCVTETFYPGWSAYAQGERREVRQALEVFCGVDTEPDDTKVRLVFEPATVRVGSFLALLGIAAVAALLTMQRRN